MFVIVGALRQRFGWNSSSEMTNISYVENSPSEASAQLLRVPPKHAEARPLSTITAPGDNAIKCPDYNQLWPIDVLARPGSWQSTCSINHAAARPLSP
jgi:hypothetical protein